jgi:uncharacterized protein YkwD
MNCAIATRVPTLPDSTCVRLLLAAGLVVGLISGGPARAAAHKLLHTKKAAEPKKHRRGKPAAGPLAPAALPVTSTSPAATPPVTPAPSAGPAPSAAPLAAPVAAAAVVTNPSSGPAEPVSSIDEQIFTLTNQVRQANDLGALTLDDALTQAAQIQASAMAELDVLNHTLPSMPQPTLANRFQFVGYSYSWGAENIAFGATDAPSVVALWMSSPPHEENLLSPIATATGIAVAYDSEGVLYFCQVFGEPQ